MAQRVKLYRIKADTPASYGQTDQAVVWAKDESDARAVFDQAMTEKDPHQGYWGGSAGTYSVTEVPRVRGPVLAEGQDG